MTDKDRVILTFGGKIRKQLDRLIEKTNAATYTEVVRRALELMEKEALK